VKSELVLGSVRVIRTIKWNV